MEWWDNNFWWFRIRGTVLMSVWWQVLFVAIYTGVIVYCDIYVPQLRMNFPQTLIPILGVVVSLLLAFRTNNAYDRYWEGRKLWTTMMQDIRKLTRAIWLGANVAPVDGESQMLATRLVERRSALNLSLAFVVSVKHYLRDEYSYDYPDLKHLVAHLPRFKTPSSNIPLEVQLKVHNSAKKTKMAFDSATPTNIPIEISYYFSSYISYVEKNGFAESWAISQMRSSVSNLVDTLGNFERILRTPIPLAYSVHLNHSVWLYILSLPFQLVGDLLWWTIPVVALGAFCLVGILSIGIEIENPFGYDANDLPLDDFCDVMRMEIEMIVGTRLLEGEEWIFSPNNYPLAPHFHLSARDLADKSADEVFQILQKVSNEGILIDKYSDIIKKTEKTRKIEKETSSYGATGYQRLG